MGKAAQSKPSISAATSATARTGAGIIVLSASELRQILTPQRCLAALEEAYANLHACPEDHGQSVGFKIGAGKFHVKAGLTPRTHAYFAAKVNANFPDNPRRFGVPTIQGLIVLCACDDGRPIALLHSGELTGRRTAAATALAAKHGARREARTLAIVGCGAQARYQAEAILAVRPIEMVIAVDRDDAVAQAFAAWATAELGVAATASSSLAGAVRASDICVTCTTATRAIITADMVPTGCFVAAIGADNPDKQEIAPQVFATARIIVDDLEQCAASGDLAHALRAGTVRTEAVAATLAQLAAGAKGGRTHDEEIVLFDSTGTGVQDVAAAAAAYEIARTRKNQTICELER